MNEQPAILASGAIFTLIAFGGMVASVLVAESEDGLTQERKAQFYRMDRAALEMGGYQRKYFVSHNPDAWAYADHVIDLAQYRV